MANSGLRLGSVYLLKFRLVRKGGSPSIPLAAPDSDLADSIAWNDFLFGNVSIASQSQSASASGTVSGTAGASQSSQVQSHSASGTAPPFVSLQSSTGHGLALQSVYAIKAYLYRKTWIVAKPTDGSPSRGWIWHDWFFGIGSETAQGSQSSTASGAVAGTAGQSTSAQGSQTDLSEGAVSGIAGTSASGQGNQTSSADAEESFYGTILATAGVEISGVTTRVYDSDTGEELWTANHGATVRCVDVDSNGNVYTGGAAGTGGYRVRKYSSGGSLVWSVDPGGDVFGIAVDSSGNVYVGGLFDPGYTIRKYDSSGTEITTGWPSNLGDVVLNLSIGDGTGYIYATGTRDGANKTTRAYTGSGSVVWSYDHGVSTYAVREIGDINYTALGGIQGSFPDFYSTRVLDSFAGTASYSYNHGATVWAIDYGNDLGGVVDNRLLLAIGDTLKSCDYDDLGTFHWTATHGDSIFGVAVSRFDGSIYIVGNQSSSITTRKYQRDGTEITTGWRHNHGGTLYGIAWSPFVPIRPVEPPGLPLEFALGIPSVGRVTLAPGLILQIELGVPNVTTIPSIPVLQATPDSNIIYRLYVTGGDLVEYPFSLIQCQRRLGQSTWIDVVIPTSSTTMLADLYERKANDGRLAIYVGVRDSNGVETMGEFLQALMWDIDSDRMPRAGSIKVRGRLIPVSFSQQSVTLTGVYQTGFDEELKHFAKCDINPNLHPNDTVFDGDLSWTAGSIDYEISTNSAWMNVEEA